MTTKDSRTEDALIIVATNHAWFARQHFYQLLACHLADTLPVLYVSAPRTVKPLPLGMLISGLLVRRRNAVSAVIQSVGPRLHILTPAMFRGAHLTPLLRVREKLLTMQIRAAMGRLNLRPTHSATLAFVAERLSILRSERRSSGQCLMYWTGDEVTDRREPWLLKNADVVFAVSGRTARQKAAKTSTPVRQMRMAIDPEPFVAARRKAVIPEEIARLPRPIIGYGGAISERLDWRLIERLALEKLGTLVFVGPSVDVTSLDRVEDLRKHGVMFLGHRDGSAAPAYLSAFDVGIIPYRLTEFNLGANPVKLYEYLASGLPIVSTPLPEVLEHFTALVAAPATANGFVSAVRAASSPAMKDPTLVARRQHLARQHGIRELALEIVEYAEYCRRLRAQK